jgi:hypothetical protein
MLKCFLRSKWTDEQLKEWWETVKDKPAPRLEEFVVHPSYTTMRRKKLKRK